LIGVVPLQEPDEALNVCPCCAVPMTVGGAVLVGEIAGEDGGGGDEQPDDGQMVSEAAAGDASRAPSEERLART
jgi:hypothetical protein